MELITSKTQLKKCSDNKIVGLFGISNFSKNIFSYLIENNIDDIFFVVSSSEYRIKDKFLGVSVISVNAFLDICISNSKDYVLFFSEDCRHFQYINELVNIEKHSYRISEIFPFQGQTLKEKELFLYSKIDSLINEIKKISSFLKPQKREECFDRYYIYDFVKKNSKYIKGDVLEFCGGDLYAKRFNLDIELKTAAYSEHKDIYKNADYYFDLDEFSSLPSSRFDCIIATQVLMYVKNPELALYHLKKLLKKDGVLIITVPGPIFHHSQNSGHMFSFTELSVKYLFDKVFGESREIVLYGDITYVQYMLFWIKKNPYIPPDKFEYINTLVIGCTGINK